MDVTAQEILAMDDAEIVPVKIPQWKGATVYLRTMTCAERDSFEADVSTQDGHVIRGKLRTAVLCRTLCDQQGMRLFSEADLDGLAKKNGVVLERLFVLSQKLNRLRASDIKEMEKNSESAPSDDSGSALP